MPRLVLPCGPLRRWWVTLGAVAASAFSPAARVHGLGNKPRPAAPTRLLTEAKSGTILEQPAANPGILHRRSELGFKGHEANLRFAPLIPKEEHATAVKTHTHMPPAESKPAVVDWRSRWG